MAKFKKGDKVTAPIFEGAPLEVYGSFHGVVYLLSPYDTTLASVREEDCVLIKQGKPLKVVPPHGTLVREIINYRADEEPQIVYSFGELNKDGHLRVFRSGLGYGWDSTLFLWEVVECRAI